MISPKAQSIIDDAKNAIFLTLKVILSLPILSNPKPQNVLKKFVINLKKNNNVQV
jgi:hypothetical protein